MQDLREKLAENLDQAEWEWLKPFVERQVIVIVAAGLDLLDVGVAIATDNVTAVNYWINEQQLYKPSEPQIASWDKETHKKFSALIVQPYVLVQET